MTHELIGLEFLKKNKIVDKYCDLNKPFAFLSYSHDEHDAQIVRNVFAKLYEKGYNLWIDIANIPYDENSWKDSASEALMTDNCKMAIYFRSESSMLKSTIKDELFMIKNLEYPIVTVDIWNDSTMNAKQFKINILKEKNLSKYKILEGICEIVDVENSALRLSADLENNINILVNEIAQQLENKEIIKNHSSVKKEDLKKEITWNEFDKVKSFSYNGKIYNVSDAQNAYITIVDVLHQNNATISPNRLVEHALPAFVKFSDGTELSIPKCGYEKLIEFIAKDKITLYAEPSAEGIPVKTYTVLSRDEEKDSVRVVNGFSDPLMYFWKYFNKLSDMKKAAWDKGNNKGNKPPIDMDVTIRFNCKCLENRSFKDQSLKKIFVNIIDYLYQMSGERYFNYIVDVCRANKWPLVIDESFEGDRKWYYNIQGSEFSVYNNYSAKEIFTYLNKHVEMYFDYLQKEGNAVDVSDVIVDYKFGKNEDAALMQIIREQGCHVKSAGSSTNFTNEPLVSFETESFVEFIKIFENISTERAREYKEKQKGNAPSIPFSNIILHLPEHVAYVNEIHAEGWQELYKAVIDALYEATDGDYCKMRTEVELNKNLKYPKIITKEYYDEFDDKAKSNYKSCTNGQYYYYMCYRSYNVLKEGIKKELDIYMNYFADSKGIQDDITSVKISYSLPESYADLFR